MRTLRFARHEAQHQAHGHPIRFAAGLALTICGAALFISDVARWLAALA